MGEQNNSSVTNKITFKLKHLNEYHDILIDPNDARYEYKDQHQQIFEQLESITGVPSRYTKGFTILRNMNPSDVNNIERYLWCFENQKAFAPDSLMEYVPEHDIFSLNIRDGERFHLNYRVGYEYSISKRISMCYELVEERDVPEEGCGRDVCRFTGTGSFFKRVKDLVSNDELNAKITQLVQPLYEILSPETHWEAHKILEEFNVLQVFYPACYLHWRWRLAEIGDARQNDLYLRTRG